MGWTYRIVDHGEHFALHRVRVDGAGNPCEWIERAIDFAFDRDCGARAVVSELEQALAEARAAPVLRVHAGRLAMPEAVDS